jgi:hypothetical protein
MIRNTRRLVSQYRDGFEVMPGDRPDQTCLLSRGAWIVKEMRPLSQYANIDSDDPITMRTKVPSTSGVLNAWYGSGAVMNEGGVDRVGVHQSRSVQASSLTLAPVDLHTKDIHVMYVFE